MLPQVLAALVLAVAAPDPNPQPPRLRVLLFADAATREYQFVRALFLREQDKGLAEVSACTQRRPAVVADVAPDRLLERFPDTLAPRANAQERPYSLAEYDLVLAFDPDWSRLSKEQAEALEKWVRRGGGLIVVAGPAHTARLGERDAAREPLLELLPVVPGDEGRSASEPRRLNFGEPGKDLAFLKLEPQSKRPLAGWEEFFTGRTERDDKVALQRGFYAYQPVRGVKPDAQVVATFSDPDVGEKGGREQPYLVLRPHGKGKVVWIGSGEMWRLRQHRPEYHERFWTQLTRHAASVPGREE
jgi:hypothetical protein